MVTVLVARWRLGQELYRQTGDTDFGVPPIAVKDVGLLDELTAAGYDHRSGYRFAKKVEDIPVGILDARDVRHEAVVDVLVPSQTSRARSNRRVGGLITIEVPGLALALQRPPVIAHLTLHRLNGTVVTARLHFPDEVGALVLKAFACRVRSKATDVVDVWRCLEVALAAGVGPDDFDHALALEGAALVRALFKEVQGPGMSALISEQGLDARAAQTRFTRVNAVIARTLPP